MITTEVSFVIGHHRVDNDELNGLFMVSWPHHKIIDFQSILNHSLDYVCAYSSGQLIGFVNLAWDGGVHAFVLDTTVHPGWRRNGIGRLLVLKAIEVARNNGIVWVHVDYESTLREFYRSCGFSSCEAGLVKTNEKDGMGMSEEQIRAAPEEFTDSIKASREEEPQDQVKPRIKVLNPGPRK